MNRTAGSEEAKAAGSVASPIKVDKKAVFISQEKARAAKFVSASNYIENVTEINMSKPESMSQGHGKAYLEAYQLGVDKKPITVEHFLKWQKMITTESHTVGHDIPKEGLGQLRGPNRPHEVQVVGGDATVIHTGTKHTEVKSQMDSFVLELNHKLSKCPNGNAMFTADILGYAFFKYEKIQPFIDGNGRSGRLLFPFIAGFTRTAVPMVNVSSDQLMDSFYSAHDSENKMKQLVAGYSKSAVIKDGRLFVKSDNPNDGNSYFSTEKGSKERVIFEWHQFDRYFRELK